VKNLLLRWRKAGTSMGGQVTSCRIWKCPKCGELLKKPSLGTVWQVGDPISKVAGTGTCLKCGAEFNQADIYGGRYDAEPEVEVGKGFEAPSQVSVVVFNLMSRTPPSDVDRYCRQIVRMKFPEAAMAAHYIVGFMDSMTPGEALAMYQGYVRAGQLPDLGRQFDSFEGVGPLGGRVVALFFRAD